MPRSLDEHSNAVPVRAERAALLTEPPEVPGMPELLAVRAGYPEGGDETVAWLTSGPVVGARAGWRDLARAFDVTGLWPLVSAGWWERPFRTGELAGPAPVPDASDVLRAGWAGTRLVRPDGTLLPQRAWPGLAAASGAATDQVELDDPPGHDGAGDLLLVPATRPADAVAQLGWFGACNWSLTGADVAAVLRSWEDRFGAYLVRIGFAELDLVVTRPPVTVQQCLGVADEHYAFCPDNFAPQTLAEPVLYSRDEYAALIRGARVWHFWWD
ncbi:conserved protein of unknown function [Modestobacter italicus]|uniref:DUF4253 domain-containing protein n=1 Tax=Modestobacter italicus (strain DSM 44449 / CECT 9708 / BC 501) TaxID=2732864 RepID=I4F5J6_MODI5|nr:DUF4253 domain-containing protein [Modestobacter marinus]CCH90909.1 conserved protein of unknown function [Modestobacter marinus]